MNDIRKAALLLTLLWICLGLLLPVAQADEPLVRAVLFWSETCSHCHIVLDQVLPPLQQKYGSRLLIQTFELSEPKNLDLFNTTLEAFRVPPERQAVPFLVVGDTVLVGSDEIPAQFPALSEKYLAAGGIGWPKIPGLEKIVELPKPAVPIVRAVMFWMNGCSHCEEVIARVLPPLQQKYGAQLDIRLIEVATDADIARLYQVGAAFGLAKEQVAVPLLLIGNQVLIGSAQIPAELPGLIEEYLASGGVDYPTVPGGADAILQPGAIVGYSIATPYMGETPSAATPRAPAESHSTLSNGFGLAMAIMVGMIAALGYAGAVIARTVRGAAPRPLPHWGEYLTLLLFLAGLGVAGYLAYVETQAVSAACGPVGDCNTVQSSPYARLFGVLPIGILGMIGYAAILAAWVWGRLRSDRLSQFAPLAMFAMALFGVAFSLYLTYLELFVIKAVCAWCLTSAVIMTLLMLLSLPRALWQARSWKQ